MSENILDLGAEEIDKLEDDPEADVMEEWFDETPHHMRQQVLPQAGLSEGGKVEVYRLLVISQCLQLKNSLL